MSTKQSNNMAGQHAGACASGEDESRYRAWVYLRHVVEASKPEILDLLWPQGWQLRRLHNEPADVQRVARMIYARDSALPQCVLASTQRRYLFDPRPVIESARRTDMWLLTPDDPSWPDELTDAFVRMDGTGADSDGGVRGQAAAPFALWIRGRASLARLTEHCVTMIGTRAASTYGRRVATDFARELAQRGYTVVSGGAIGIDKQVHMAAVESGIPTVAFLANGVDVNYPAGHAQLFQQIIEGGGVLVSEYAPGTPPARHRFLTRNRLVAAVGQATVMVEAPIRSGAMNTMNWAEAMLKPTLAVPGCVTSAASQGSLLRIQQGRALLVRTVDDIVGVVNPVGDQLQLELELGHHQASVPDGDLLSWQETAVFDATGIDTDDLGYVGQMQEDTGLAGAVVMRTVRDLEKRGYVVRRGDRWVKAR